MHIYGNYQFYFHLFSLGFGVVVVDVVAVVVVCLFVFCLTYNVNIKKGLKQPMLEKNVRSFNYCQNKTQRVFQLNR